MRVLQNFDPDLFLKKYWQKSPVLIRNAVSGMDDLLGADDLAGLACEEGIESRLVEYSATPETWKVSSGPFAEERLMSLPTRDWSLLVQAVDHYVPDVSQLLQQFRFIPDWRLDDVMVSVAAEGGSVGPHFDQYDVFLIQGAGKRKWSIGQECSHEDRLRLGQELAILEEFKEEDSWILSPGDMLYLPPKVAHWGIAVGEEPSLCYSIGFRAPSLERLLTGIVDEVAQQFSEDDRYEDPDLTRQENSGEIPREAIRKIGKIFSQISQNEDLLMKWFGEELTERKYTDLDYQPDISLTTSEIEERLLKGDRLFKSEHARFAFSRRSPKEIMFFVDAQSAVFKGQEALIIESLCQTHQIHLDQFKKMPEMLAELVNTGYLRFEEA